MANRIALSAIAELGLPGGCCRSSSLAHGTLAICVRDLPVLVCDVGCYTTATFAAKDLSLNINCQRGYHDQEQSESHLRIQKPANEKQRERNRLRSVSQRAQ